MRERERERDRGEGKEEVEKEGEGVQEKAWRKRKKNGSWVAANRVGK